MFGFQGFASLKRAFLAPFQTAQAKPACPLPADNELFQLTLDASKADPKAMLAEATWNTRHWKFVGKQTPGICTSSFKLVRLGRVWSLADASAKAYVLGVNLAEGLWAEAFKAAYPHNEGTGPVVFGGATSEWVAPPDDYPFYIFLREWDESWRFEFRMHRDGYDNDWRWLVRELSH